MRPMASKGGLIAAGMSLIAAVVLLEAAPANRPVYIGARACAQCHESAGMGDVYKRQLLGRLVTLAAGQRADQPRPLLRCHNLRRRHSARLWTFLRPRMRDPRQERRVVEFLGFQNRRVRPLVDVAHLSLIHI